MTNIINFHSNQIQKKLEDPSTIFSNTNDMSLHHEIYISVIRNVYAYIEKELEDPLLEISPTDSLSQLFDDNTHLFLYCLLDLSRYWNFEFNIEEIPYGKKGEDGIFMLYPTISHLCQFVENKVTN